MASVTFDSKRNRWRVQFRSAGLPRSTRYFKTEAEAERWRRNVEHSADLGKPIGGRGEAVDALLRRYRQARADSGKAIAPTSNQHYMLRTLERHFAGVPVGRLTPQTVVEFAQRRRRAGAGAYTVNMDISQLATALRYACVLAGHPFPSHVFEAARQSLHHLGLIGPGRKRERRPTREEWDRLVAHLDTLPTAIPMRDVVTLAAITGLRRGEVCRLRWADLDERRSVILVRARKHPRAKETNNQTIPLVRQALQVIRRQARTGDRIFPFEPGTVSYWFRQAVRALGIEDLRLHDMRHEAASSMLEAGFSVPETAAVTGHQDWRQLRRYTQLKPEAISRKRVPRR